MISVVGPFLCKEYTFDSFSSLGKDSPSKDLFIKLFKGRISSSQQYFKTCGETSSGHVEDFHFNDFIIFRTSSTVVGTNSDRVFY